MWCLTVTTLEAVSRASLVSSALPFFDTKLGRYEPCNLVNSCNKPASPLILSPLLVTTRMRPIELMTHRCEAYLALSSFIPIGRTSVDLTTPQ